MLSGLVQATGHLKETIIGLLPSEMERISVRALSDSEPVDYNALLCLQRWVSCSNRGADSVLPQQTVVVVQFSISHIELWMESRMGDSNSRLHHYQCL